MGTATAWRVATMLRDDLGIEARATASWIAKLKAGERPFDNRTVLIVDFLNVDSSGGATPGIGVVEGGSRAFLVVI
jgi:hypothetical protein